MTAETSSIDELVDELVDEGKEICRDLRRFADRSEEELVDDIMEPFEDMFGFGKRIARACAIEKAKPKLDSLLEQLREIGWEPGLTEDSYLSIIASGFRSKNLLLASAIAEIACNEQPITLRGLLYRVVSAGWLPSTDQSNYNRVNRILTTLREKGVIPFRWIVDNVRTTIKPSSWSGIGDFADTVRDAYRKDFWASLPSYVHIFCEKDAIAGTLSPVTQEFDVALSPIRGYVSLSYSHEIAEQWQEIAANGKGIFAYYLGDYDPSGFDLERDLREKLRRYGADWVNWTRIGVNLMHFKMYDLIPLKAKKTDTRYKSFAEEHGEQCAEVDAIPPNELRRMVRDSIEQHIPQEEWERLKQVEETERESFNKVMANLGENT